MATAPTRKQGRAKASSNGESESGARGGGRRTERSAVAATTPWGSAAILEEVSVPQRAGDRRFAVVVQLLESDAGERLIRFAYTTSGTTRRGPVTMRARDLERLRAALERAPALQEVLRL